MCMGSGLCCGWLHAMYNVLAYTEHDKCGLSCTYAETVESMHEQCWVCMVCMVCVVYGLYGRLEFKLCCEILLLLNMVDMDRWNSYCGVTKLSTLFI